MAYQKRDSKIPSAADKKLTVLNVFSQLRWRAGEPEPMHSISIYPGVYQYIGQSSGPPRYRQVAFSASKKPDAGTVSDSV